jgi:hypothetical protein
VLELAQRGPRRGGERLVVVEERAVAEAVAQAAEAMSVEDTEEEVDLGQAARRALLCARQVRFVRRSRAIFASADVEGGVLQLAPQHVVAPDAGEILLEAEDVEDVGQRAERGGRGALFEGAQGGPRHAGALGDLAGGQLAATTREAEVAAQGGQEAGDAGLDRGRGPGHENILAILAVFGKDIFTFTASGAWGWGRRGG